MTTALALIAALTAPPALACPDLSGRYAIPGEDGIVLVTIAQTGCDTMRVEWLIRTYLDTSRTTRLFTLDGVFRADSGWVARSRPSLKSARFVGDRLELLRMSGPGATVESREAFHLLAGRDLCLTLEVKAGRPWPPRSGILAVRADPGTDATAALRRRKIDPGTECAMPTP